MTNAISKQKEYYMGSDGNMEYYPDAYDVGAEQIEEADRYEEFILKQQDGIEKSFLMIGAALAQFDQKMLWKAKGYPSFRAWVSAPEIHFSYEHANRLIRIVNELLPALDITTTDYPVSVLKELLPMLSDGSGEEKVKEAYEAIEGMTVSDAKKTIREMRGIEESAPQLIFRARVVIGEDSHKVGIRRTGGEDGDIYEVGTLTIKKKDWKQWESRFGQNFIEYIK